MRQIFEVKMKPTIDSNIHWVIVRIESESLGAVLSTIDILFPDYEVNSIISGFV